MRAFACVVLMCCLLAPWNTTRVGSHNLGSQTAPNVVTDWALVAQNTIAPTVFLGGQLAYGPMVPIAMYDAAVAIAGGYRSYTPPVIAPAGADETAAIATAAFRVLHERFPAQAASLESQYANYMANILDGQAKTDGIAVGEAVAWQLLTMRAGDGLETCVGPCSSNPPYVQPPPGPGVFEPFPAGSTPVGASLSIVRSWTMNSADQFRPEGPLPLTSVEYADDWAQTRDWGSSTSTRRSAYDDDTARFWAGQTLPATRQTLRRVETIPAKAKGAIHTAPQTAGLPRIPRKSQSCPKTGTERAAILPRAGLETNTPAIPAGARP